jgi:hypothetical protein
MADCVFCGSPASWSSGSGNGGICGSCLRSLAETLHNEDGLGVRELEREVHDIKR